MQDCCLDFIRYEQEKVSYKAILIKLNKVYIINIGNISESVQTGFGKESIMNPQP